MKAFKVHNAEKVKQEVNLPAGTYSYSFRVIPVGTSYTFKLDNLSFTFEGLTAGVLNKRMKHTFELTEAVSFFYLSNTIGDCVYEPQIEEGVFATTPGAHPLDFERLISEAGIEIDHEALSLYAKKADVSSEIKIQTDRIDSTVGNISNDIDGVKGDMTTISQTVNSITSTVTNHTTQISTFQQTVNQIYASIEDVGSGEFAHILQRIDQIELKVGAPGQSGSIQLAIDSIASTVYDEDEGMSAIIQKVNSITSTVTNHTTQISTFQQTVDQIYASIQDIDSGDFSSILQRLDLIELSVGNISGNLSTLTQTVNGFEARVQTAEGNLSTLTQTVNGISAKVFDEHENLLSQITQDGETILIQASQIKLEGLITANNNFKVLTDGSIEAKNGKFTGEINATSGSFTGTVIAKQGSSGMQTWLDSSGIRVFNDTGQMNIRFGMKNGYAVLEYFDNAGKFLYDLGPNGLMKAEVRGEKWTEFKRISLGTVLSTILSSNKDKYKRSWLYTEVTYYVYTSAISAGVVLDPANDGKIFTTKSKTGPRMPNGYYCRRVATGGVNMQYPNNGTYAIINSQLPNIHSANESVYDRNIICVTELESYINGSKDSSTYYAYWNE